MSKNLLFAYFFQAICHKALIQGLAVTLKYGGSESSVQYIMGEIRVVLGPKNRDLAQVYGKAARYSQNVRIVISGM